VINHEPFLFVCCSNFGAKLSRVVGAPTFPALTSCAASFYASEGVDPSTVSNSCLSATQHKTWQSASHAAHRVHPTYIPGRPFSTCSSCALVFGPTFHDEISPAPCHYCTAGRPFAGGDQLFQGSTLYRVPFLCAKVSPAPCYHCTTGRPSAGCDQILSAPILVLGPFLLFLAALRGQISVPTPFPRSSDRHHCGVFPRDLSLCRLKFHVH
jgi:hypothetical protein